ncbi:EamA family transporter RarD [Thaumasiovibrio sp. DFM-14]|uniref:EamA family transporter RarD n=1 Tax=Thaumasiovibrio sp. DFM-14 TaxID=3384792 RepID=UPI00399FB30A
MNQQSQAQRGVILALAAYTMWGVAPIYFKSVSQVNPMEILSHRIIWSFFLLGGLLSFTNGWPRVQQVLRRPTQRKLLLLTALLVGGNWLTFIWAIGNNRMLEASLGYFINPIFNVTLGMLFLKERLRPMQWIAVALSATGVVIQVINFGSVPWVSLVLAGSFGCYGLLRKKINVGAEEGLFIETAVIVPLALAYLWLSPSETSNLFNNTVSLNVLLMAAGIVTTLPLLCFTGAATKLNLSTLGFFQYIGPSLMFILAISVYGETLALDDISTFAFIWCALVIFTVDAVRFTRRQRLTRQKTR